MRFQRGSISGQAASFNKRSSRNPTQRHAHWYYAGGSRWFPTIGRPCAEPPQAGLNGYYLTGLFRQTVCLSVISRIEVLGWRGHTDDSWQVTRDFLATLQEIGLDEAVVQRTIQIRRTVRIKLPDAIIASSALSSNLELVTRNSEDFRRVPGLSVVNPLDLHEWHT